METPACAKAQSRKSRPASIYIAPPIFLKRDAVTYIDSVTVVCLSVSSMLRTLRDLLETSELAELGPATRPGTLSEGAIAKALRGDPQFITLSTERQAVIHSLLLLWHDHLDASHSISQGINTADGALIHGMMHRREGDYANAGYWFHRAGEHPSYAELSRRVSNFLAAQDKKLLKSLRLADGWNPLQFVQACAEAATGKNPDEERLRQIQKIEGEVLLEYFSGEEPANSKGRK
jgi:hypothetical protein